MGEVASLEFRKVKTDYVGSTSRRGIPDLYVVGLPTYGWLILSEKGGIGPLLPDPELANDPFPVSPPHIEEPPPQRPEPAKDPGATGITDDEAYDMAAAALGLDPIGRIAEVALEAAGSLTLPALGELIDEMDADTPVAGFKIYEDEDSEDVEITTDAEENDDDE